MSYTKTTNYNLKKIDYNTEQNAWGGHLNDNFDIIDGIIKTLSDQLLPVGSIVAWHKSLPGTPDLDLAGTWLECNGQTIDDTESIYYGQAIPNLNNPKNSYNSKGSFLRGHTTSGEFEDDQFQDHSHTLTLNNSNGNAGTGYPLRTQEPTTSISVSSSVNDGTNGEPRAGMETHPVNMSVVWVMRVK